MQISDILSPDRVACDVDLQSKKAALEALSQMVADAEESLTRSEVFDSLLARERLGSTGLGHGIALPHGRLKGGEHTLGAFIRLRAGVDYDAIDHAPVDLVFALLVPEEATDEHLKILAMLAEKFSADGFLQKLRRETTAEGIYKLLVE